MGRAYRAVGVRGAAAAAHGAQPDQQTQRYRPTTHGRILSLGPNLAIARQTH